ILYNAISMRLKDRSDVGTQIADLSRGTADLARQVAEFGRRLAAVEARTTSNETLVNSRVDPLAGEMSELGILMNQLAISVAAHDEALVELTAIGSAIARPVTAPIPLAASAQPSIVPSQPEIAAAEAAKDNEAARAAAKLANTVKAAVEANR